MAQLPQDLNTSVWRFMDPRKKLKLKQKILDWLGNNYAPANKVCLPRNLVYEHYIGFCLGASIPVADRGAFGKIIAEKFSQMRMRRLGSRGNNQYYYYGVDLHPDLLIIFRIAAGRIGSEQTVTDPVSIPARPLSRQSLVEDSADTSESDSGSEPGDCDNSLADSEDLSSLSSPSLSPRPLDLDNHRESIRNQQVVDVDTVISVSPEAKRCVHHTGLDSQWQGFCSECCGEKELSSVPLPDDYGEDRDVDNNSDTLSHCDSVKELGIDDEFVQKHAIQNLSFDMSWLGQPSNACSEQTSEAANFNMPWLADPSCATIEQETDDGMANVAVSQASLIDKQKEKLKLKLSYESDFNEHMPLVLPATDSEEQLSDTATDLLSLNVTEDIKACSVSPLQSPSPEPPPDFLHCPSDVEAALSDEQNKEFEDSDQQLKDLAFETEEDIDAPSENLASNDCASRPVALTLITRVESMECLSSNDDDDRDIACSPTEYLQNNIDLEEALKTLNREENIFAKDEAVAPDDEAMLPVADCDSAIAACSQSYPSSPALQALQLNDEIDLESPPQSLNSEKCPCVESPESSDFPKVSNEHDNSNDDDNVHVVKDCQNSPSPSPTTPDNDKLGIIAETSSSCDRDSNSCEKDSAVQEDDTASGQISPCGDAMEIDEEEVEETANREGDREVPSGGGPQPEQESPNQPAPDEKLDISWPKLSPGQKQLHKDRIDEWLGETFEINPQVCLLRTTLYNHYCHHCENQRMSPSPQPLFGRMLQHKFRWLKMRRLGTRSNSKYYYMGIDMKSFNDKSPHFQALVADRLVTPKGRPKCSRVFNGAKKKH